MNLRQFQWSGITTACAARWLMAWEGLLIIPQIKKTFQIKIHKIYAYPRNNCWNTNSAAVLPLLYAHSVLYSLFTIRTRFETKQSQSGRKSLWITFRLRPLSLSISISMSCLPEIRTQSLTTAERPVSDNQTPTITPNLFALQLLAAAPFLPHTQIHSDRHTATIGLHSPQISLDVIFWV